VAKLRDGDLFAIPLPDRDWLTGRLLLDVNRVLAGKHLLLVEVYAEPSAEPSERVSRALIPSAWVDADGLAGRAGPRWPIVGHRAVVPAEVDFPERVINVGGKTTFEKGELRVPIPAPLSEMDRYECDTLALLSSQLIDVCNYYLDRKQHLGPRPETFSLRRIDLRFSPYREEVYRLMGEAPGRRYAEWATGQGLDPARLWA
jgi:hypothetical protein